MHKSHTEYMLANTASGDRIALFNSHAHDNHLPQFQPPEWAENLHSRAIMYIGSQSHASSLNLSHADLAATLACVVRAGAFVEKEDHQKHRLPRETTQSIDMSIVTSPRTSIHRQRMIQRIIRRKTCPHLHQLFISMRPLL